jgi:hypothetical protein
MRVCATRENDSCLRGLKSVTASKYEMANLHLDGFQKRCGFIFNNIYLFGDYHELRAARIRRASSSG